MRITFIEPSVCLSSRRWHFCQIRGLNRRADHKPVDELAYNSYKFDMWLELVVLESRLFVCRSRFMKPSVGEGFREVVNVNFVPRFPSEHDREQYLMFLL